MCGKQKKMCEQGQYLREKREKPKKCVKYYVFMLFYVHVLGALGTPLKRFSDTS